jgi:dihydropteroate synthase
VDRGAAVVRVHDVRDTVAALAVWRAMKAQESQQQTQEQTSTP